MWEDAGLVRDAQGLGHAASVLAAWRAAHRTPLTEAEHEDENLLAVAQALVDAALARRRVGRRAPPQPIRRAVDADFRTSSPREPVVSGAA